MLQLTHTFFLIRTQAEKCPKCKNTAEAEERRSFGYCTKSEMICFSAVRKCNIAHGVVHVELVFNLFV